MTMVARLPLSYMYTMKVKRRHLRQLAVQPAKRGVRLIALSALQHAESAFTRITADADAEALHDFRVSLRRLRSCLQVYDAWLRPPVRKKHVRTLGKIARASNPSRDLEVLIDRLREIGEPTADERRGIALLTAHFASERTEQLRRFREQTLACFPPLARVLRKTISLDEPRLRVKSGRQPLGRITSGVASGMRADLRAYLAAVRAIEDENAAHQARIVGKKLRYLFEPFCNEHPECELAVQALGQLQDALGCLQDTHVLFARSAAVVSAATAADQPYLRAAHERVRELRARAFREIQRNYLENDAVGLLDQIQLAEAAIAAALVVSDDGRWRSKKRRKVPYARS